MSTATIGKSKYSDMRVVRINGRQFYLDRIAAVEKTSEYAFKVTHSSGMVFEVWGGKKSGGTAKDWFCVWPNGKDALCTSLADALKMLNGI